jgi:DNA mismatch repair ATPase MutS
MKALLMHPDRDFDMPAEPRRYQREPTIEPPQHQQRALIKDLELNTLLAAMAGDDEFLLHVARTALLARLQNDLGTILYRQEIVKDCLNNSAVIRALYSIAVETIETKRKHHFGIFTRYPAGILSSAVNLLQALMQMLVKLRAAIDLHTGQFQSRGLSALFSTLRAEFSDNYFAEVQGHLAKLTFKGGVLITAELGTRNEGTHYVLREPPPKKHWLKRILGTTRPAYTFYIHPRDEAGARALSELRDRGINLAANAVAQATEHIVSFFEMLKTELAFYVCCLNLHDRLTSLGMPICLPRPEIAGPRSLHFSGLYDVCLALSMGQSVAPNTIDVDGKNLVIITGANQGGKSSFLRSIGLAQVMMQCGMFVGAESLTNELCAGVFTHYKREEDPAMKSGKLDEELSRMSDIAEVVLPNAMILFNESFAATNEREGSEIARQVVSALLEKRVKVFFVTHLYEFSRSFFEKKMEDALFLRAERRPDGTRTFKVLPGDPLETSYGEDVYKKIFGTDS